MRNVQNGRRRGRGGPRPPQGGNGRSPDMGNRMEMRQRGNAHQLLEKYKSLARDATSQGDRVAAEYYMQYADHYYRVLNEYRLRQEEQRARYRYEGHQDGQQDDGQGDDEADAEGDADIDEGMPAEDMRGPDPIAIRGASVAPVAQISESHEEADDGDMEADVQQVVEEALAPARRPRGRPRRIRPEEQNAPMHRHMSEDH